MTGLIQLVMAISLLAMPANIAVCQAAPVAQPEMPCCGQADESCCEGACHCPATTMCMAAPVPAQDRAAAQAPTGISHPVPVLLYALSSHRETDATQTVKLVVRDEAPPPLAVGSPPQAKLRVWLL
jgi:hypothetical protein